MESLWHDLRYALRSLRQHPLFTTVAVITIGLGIGANTAIFSVIDAVVLQPLSYDQPQQLISVVARDAKTGEQGVQLSFPNYRDVRASSTTLTQVAPFRYWLFNVSGSDHPESVLGIYVGDSLFDVLRVHPLLGHFFAGGVEVPGRPREVVLSYSMWQRRFGADPNIVGRAAVIDGAPTTVIGVLPRAFRFPDLVPTSAPMPSRSPDVYMPVGTMSTAGDLTRRGNDNYWILARMRPGIGMSAASQDLNRIAGTLAKDYPENDARLLLQPVSLQDRVTGDVSRPLMVLFGAVSLVLLIACANVGGLLLARAVERQREISIRTALDASPRRLARQMLTESILLGLLGGIAGVAMASWGVALVRIVAPSTIPRIDQVEINGRVLTFALIGSLVTGIIFGMAPVLQSRARGFVIALRESGRSSGGGTSRRLRAALVIAEVALAVVLLSGAGLLLRSFASLSRVRPGFDGANVMTMFTLLPPSRYPTDSTQIRFVRQVLAGMNQIPDVSSAAIVNTLPLSNLGSSAGFEVVGRPAAQSGARPNIDSRTVAGPYFRTLGMSIVQGRDFNASDTRDVPVVAILNQSAVRQYFPGEDPLGKQVKVGNDQPRTIVGVVQDVHGVSLDSAAKPEVTSPFEQAPDIFISLAIRTRGDPHAILPQIRRALAAVDPDQAFYAERTMSDLVSASLASHRFNLQLLGGFALLALILAAVGLYGVIAFSVSQRTQEIGIRAALGAERSRISRLVLGEGMRLGAIGLGLGLIGSFAATRMLRGLLYQVQPTDPVTLAGVVFFLGLVVLLASYLPARRAARIDPVNALRNE